MNKHMTTIAALFLMGCVPAGPAATEKTVPFNPSEVSYIRKSGVAKIAGQAFLRQQGGGVVTCAGEEVTLIPAGGYARARVSWMTGSENGGRVGAFGRQPKTKANPQFVQMVRKTQCDADGNFEFKSVANGDYYVATQVIWFAGNSFIPEGAGLIKLIPIRGGRSQKILLN